MYLKMILLTSTPKKGGFMKTKRKIEVYEQLKHAVIENEMLFSEMCESCDEQMKQSLLKDMREQIYDNESSAETRTFCLYLCQQLEKSDCKKDLNSGFSYQLRYSNR